MIFMEDLFIRKIFGIYVICLYILMCYRTYNIKKKKKFIKYDIIFYVIVYVYLLLNLRMYM